MFSSAPSNAAEIVPEYVTSSPRFGPKLMPETTMSGRFPFSSDKDGEVDAVGRRAVDDPLVVFELEESQRTVERQRVRSGALLAVGRDDDDFADGAKRVRELADAFAVDAVVIRDEDSRHRFAS